MALMPSSHSSCGSWRTPAPVSSSSGAAYTPERLRHDMARRGWANCDLARAAGISAPTVTAALRGRPVAPQTVRKIATALARATVVEGIDSII